MKNQLYGVFIMTARAEYALAQISMGIISRSMDDFVLDAAKQWVMEQQRHGRIQRGGVVTIATIKGNRMVFWHDGSAVSQLPNERTRHVDTDKIIPIMEG